MEHQGILPPGEHPYDMRKEIDVIAGHLAKIQTSLIWIDQYRLNLEYLRATDTASTEKEWGYLRDTTEEALRHLQRLTELLLAGYSVDRSKQIPKAIQHFNWGKKGEQPKGKKGGRKGEGRKGDAAR